MSTQKGTLINKYTPDYVIFDLETTGISPNYDEVIEISALKVKGGEVVDEFNTLVNPGRKIPFWSDESEWNYKCDGCGGTGVFACSGRVSGFCGRSCSGGT